MPLHLPAPFRLHTPRAQCPKLAASLRRPLPPTLLLNAPPPAAVTSPIITPPLPPAPSHTAERNPDVGWRQVQCCIALRNLAAGEPHSVNAVVKGGAIDLVLQAMMTDD